MIKPNNKVINKYIAIVDGRSTGLAGCQNSYCKRVCLRKHPVLEKACHFGKSQEPCDRFISIEAA